ncbi:MAG: isoprenoid biosynthesis glyoxalase ElbB [Bacteroidota bacterium]|nr:isoprenoid biosynthesis glyoxalase ElbB [Bacteroidota bacterium]
MSKAKTIAIILSGNGVYDGAEIHEATLTMLAVAKEGGEYQLFAPDKEQHHVINHLTGDEMDEKRNVLIEAARIARGDIKKLSDLDMKAYDALMMPGGFGVAKNLSSFAFDGANCTVDSDLERIVKSAVEAGKPIGALCISPAVVAKILDGAEVTIGQDEDTAKAISEMGAKHKLTTHGEVVIDHKYKVATTPCYMLDANILEIAQGAENVTKAVFEMI